MNKPDRKEPGLPSPEEVRKWRRKMEESQDSCVAYSMTAEGFDLFLRLSEAERYYQKNGLL